MEVRIMEVRIMEVTLYVFVMKYKLKKCAGGKYPDTSMCDACMRALYVCMCVCVIFLN